MLAKHEYIFAPAVAVKTPFDEGRQTRRKSGRLHTNCSAAASAGANRKSSIQRMSEPSAEPSSFAPGVLVNLM